MLLLARHVREAIDPWYMTAKCLVVGGVGTRDKRTFQRNGLATFTTSWANPSQGRDKKQFPSLILGQRCNESRMYNCRALEVASRAVFSGGQWLLLTLRANCSLFGSGTDLVIVICYPCINRSFYKQE